MLKVAIRLAVVVVVFLGIRAFLENQAERMLGVATEMYEDAEYEQALDKIRDMETFLGWTDASDKSDELSDDIRKAIKHRRQSEETDRWIRKMDEQQRAEEERELEHQRQMERSKQEYEQRRELQKSQPTPRPKRR